MNIVIIDTCIFIDKEQDFFFESPILKLLKESKDVKIIMPKVIVEEITKRVELIIDNTNNTITEKNKKLEKYKISDLYKLTHLDKNVVINDFHNQLLAFYKNNNIELEDYPQTITVQNVLDRALSKKKPFKNDGGDAGFKDYLIWLTIMEIAKKHPSDNINFVTANKKDFTKDKNLHEDLIEDLSSLNIKNINSNVFQTLEEFKNASLDLKSIDEDNTSLINNVQNKIVENVNIDNENMISDIINKIIDGEIEIFSIGEISLAEYLERNYEKISDILDITSDIFGYQVQLEDFVNLSLDNNSIKYNNTDDEEYYIEFHVDCDAEASIGGTWDGEYVGSCKLKVNISVTYNTVESIIENISIDDVDLIDSFSNDDLYNAENAFHIGFIKDNF